MYLYKEEALCLHIELTQGFKYEKWQCLIFIFIFEQSCDVAIRY